jgi:hypothetical protein
VHPLDLEGVARWAGCGATKVDGTERGSCAVDVEGHRQRLRATGSEVQAVKCAVVGEAENDRAAVRADRDDVVALAGLADIDELAVGL